MTKGERLYKDCTRGEVRYKLDMNMDKEGVTLAKREGSKVLNKRSTQVGGASS